MSTCTAKILCFHRSTELFWTKGVSTLDKECCKAKTNGDVVCGGREVKGIAGWREKKSKYQ